MNPGPQASMASASATILSLTFKEGFLFCKTLKLFLDLFIFRGQEFCLQCEYAPGMPGALQGQQRALDSLEPVSGMVVSQIRMPGN